MATKLTQDEAASVVKRLTSSLSSQADAIAKANGGNWQDPAIKAIHDRAVQISSNYGFDRDDSGNLTAKAGSNFATDTSALRKNLLSKVSGNGNGSGTVSTATTPVVTPPVTNNAPKFTPMSQTDYYKNANDIANANASLQYDSVLADLKAKVAQIIADQQLRQKQVQGDYAKQYTQNEADRYQSGQQTDSAMARRGLLNTGIDVANDQANQLRYDMGRQNIDIAKQNELDAIANEIGKAQTQQSYDENKILAQKNAYLAGQKAQTFKDYNDYMMKVYGMDLDTWYKQQQVRQGDTQLEQGDRKLDIDQQQTDNQYEIDNKKIEQGNRDLNLKQDQINKNYEIDTKKLEQDNTHFYADLNQKASQFAEEMGFKKEELTEKIRQFNEQLGFDREKLKQETSVAYAQMSNSLKIANLDYDASMKKLEIEKTQMWNDYNLAADELDQNDKQIVMKESDRVDNLILDAFTKAAGNKNLQKQLPTVLEGIINSSSLDNLMKKEKLDMINNSIVSK